MTDIDTTGKTVTTKDGKVITDVGRSHWGKYIRLCVSDNGIYYHVLDTVIQELPITHRRDSLPPTSLIGDWPEDWHRQ